MHSHQAHPYECATVHGSNNKFHNASAGIDSVAPRKLYCGGHHRPRHLYVVTCISNPLGFNSRYKLYREFAKRVEDAGATLITVEMAFGDRPHVVTNSHNPHHVQVRSFFELWHKENMLNLGIARLMQVDPHADRVAWLDADVQLCEGWVEKTLEALEHYMVVQMFSQAFDLDPRGETIREHWSFMHNYYHNTENFCHEAPEPYYSTKIGHTGFAWAARMEAIDHLGGLIDQAILGSADWYMAHALVGLGRKARLATHHDNYHAMIDNWEARAEERVKRDVGYVSGVLLHYYHGPRSKRGYGTRDEILVKNQYDPQRDIYRDSQGLWQLCDKKIGLREGIRRYLRSRHEDCIEEGTRKLMP